MEVTFPTAVTFNEAEWAMTKVQALKVLEEAAELVEAVKDYRIKRKATEYLGESPVTDLLSCGDARSAALDEAMDVYQALANLLAGEYTKAEIAGAYEQCKERNGTW